MAIPAPADPDAAARKRNAREYSSCLELFGWLATITEGLPVNQYEHSLQCADRATQAGAREELIVVALLHDVGKPLSEISHPAVAAELLKGRVSEGLFWVLKTHGEFQRALNHGLGTTLMRYGRMDWYDDAEALSRWDHASFEPGRDVPGLDVYYPMLRRVYGVENS